MKRFWITLTGIALLAGIAAAQDDATQKKAKAEIDKLQTEFQKMATESKILRFNGAVMGSAVKGAPYSAVEVSESTQMLFDGTRIHNENRVTVSRDSEGRVRRETPDQVTIWDPIANVSYFLDPKNQVAHKSSMVRTFVYSSKERTGGATVEVRQKDGTTTATIDGKPVDPSVVAHIKIAPPPPPPPPEAGLHTEGFAITTREPMMVSGNVVYARKTHLPAKTESLGTRNIEGVNCEGTRSVTTLEAGAIGNDRPIEITDERWYSPDLQTVVMTRHNDPRTGEEVFRLTDISRTEPAAYLFQVPPGFQTTDRK